MELVPIEKSLDQNEAFSKDPSYQKIGDMTVDY